MVDPKFPNIQRACLRIVKILKSEFSTWMEVNFEPNKQLEISKDDFEIALRKPKVEKYKFIIQRR